MKKIIIKLTIISAIILHVQLLYSAVQFSFIRGDVRIQKKNSILFRKARKSDPITTGDKIRTMAGSEAVIKYRSGTVTVIKERTLLVVNSVETSKQNLVVELNLKRGGLWNKIGKLKKDEKFNFKTPSCIAGVRGTDVGLDTDGRDTDILLLKGLVEIFAQTGTKLLLKEGKKVKIKKGKDAGKPEELTKDEKELIKDILTQITKREEGAKPTFLKLITPVTVPYLAGVSEKGNTIKVLINGSAVIDDELLSASFKFNIESYLNEDPYGEVDNAILVIVKNADGMTAAAGATVLYDRTKPAVDISYDIEDSRVYFSGSIGESGTLLINGEKIALDGSGNIAAGSYIPLDKILNGKNNVFAADRAGNIQSTFIYIMKARVPPAPPSR
ncbi:FecR domain-containing protein [Spirochaetota bacterium]